jgi:hypothetical protein
MRSEVEVKRGRMVKIADTRRFSIPVSQSIRQLVSRHFLYYCNGLT